MKKFKFAIIMCFVIINVLFCAGCAENDNFPKANDSAYQQTLDEASLRLLNSGITDPATFSKETGLVAYTINKRVNFLVSFLYEESETGKVYTLRNVEGFAQYINDNEYRQLYNAQLTEAVLDQIEKEKLGDGNIVGVILSWERDKGFFGEPIECAVCDFDGDGTWDYIGENLYFLVSSEPHTEIHRVVNEDTTVGLSNLWHKEEIVELTELKGDEKLKDLEKLL